MPTTADHYLKDLGYLVREQALEVKAEAERTKDAFTLGRLTAYHDIVSLMQSQALAFSIPLERLSLDGFEPDSDLL